MTNADIPALVAELRRRLDLTQEQFAQRIGVTYSTVNHWENGRRVPQPFLLARLLELAAELEVDSRASGKTARPVGPLGPGERKRGEATEPSTRRGGVREAIQEMVHRIVERFRPEKVILFGSHARGDARPNSDVDLLIVMRVQGSKRQAQLRVREALHDIRVPKDLIVTSPEDFEWRKEIVGTIERPASREGKVLYARG